MIPVLNERQIAFHLFYHCQQNDIPDPLSSLPAVQIWLC